jgi:hypothetical protein
MSGLPWKLYQSDKTASYKVESFISKQHIPEGSNIISGYLPYYDLKKERCNIYVETEKSGTPTFNRLSTLVANELLTKRITNILLKYEKWGNKTTVSDNYDYYIYVDHPWEYNKNEIRQRVNKYLLDSNSHLEQIDKLEYPVITIFKIIKNN